MLAGTSVISARLVSASVGVLTITAVSMLFALLLLVPLCGRKLIQTMRAMSARNWLATALQGLFGIFAFRMFLLYGLLRTSTAEAGILTGATPAVTAILAFAVLREKARFHNLAGIVCTVFGILLIQGLVAAKSAFSATHFWGNMLVLAAAASESAFNIISRIAAVKSKSSAPLNPLVQTTLVCIITLILCLIPALYEQPIQVLAAIGPMEWGALAWYGLFVTALAFICWYAGIKRCLANTAAAFSGMMPLTSLVLSVAVFAEQTHWQQWVGCFLIITGMALIGRKPSRQSLDAVTSATP
jgi:drug/metabolite transporter (DMT)-like permease